MDIPKLLKGYWIPHLIGLDAIRFDDFDGFGGRDDLGDPNELIGLNPKHCRVCGNDKICLDYDVLQWEKNMLIIITATKCLSCQCVTGKPDQFAIHFCENCTKPMKPRGGKFMYADQFRTCNGKEVCETCFNDLGCTEVIASIFG